MKKSKVAIKDLFGLYVSLRQEWQQMVLNNIEKSKDGFTQNQLLEMWTKLGDFLLTVEEKINIPQTLIETITPAIVAGGLEELVKEIDTRRFSVDLKEG